jgi:hypothetical protein
VAWHPPGLRGLALASLHHVALRNACVRRQDGLHLAKLPLQQRCAGPPLILQSPMIVL